jgi:hypothetical protein
MFFGGCIQTIAENSSHPDLKTYYSNQDTVTGIGRHMDQWNRIMSPEINAHICSQLIFNKGAKTGQRGKNSPFIKCCWANWIATRKRMKLNLPHFIHKLTNSK